MPLTDSLVAWWSLDESSGTRADSHGANGLTDNNTVGSEAAKQSNGALFVAANNEYLSIADNAALSGSDRDFMLCGWVLLNSFPATTCGIIGKGNGVANASGEYYLRYNHSSTRFQWRAFTGSAGATITDGSGAPALETWYFIELWHDAANNQIGMRVNRGTAVTGSFAGPVANTTGAFRMGQDPSGANYFDGVLDEWGFWDRLLTSDELDELYNGGAGRDYAYISGGSGPATYTGTGNATLPALTASGSATHTAPTFEGTGASTLPALTASGAATHTAPEFEAAGSATLPTLTATGAASHDVPGFNATGAVTLPALTASGDASHEAPTFAAEGDATLPALTASGSASFGTAVFSGTGNATLPAVTAAGEGSFSSEPIFSATGAASLSALEASGAATHAAPVYTASGAVILPMIVVAAEGENTPSLATGTGAATLPALEAAGVATFELVLPTFEVSARVAFRQIATQSVPFRQTATGSVAIRQTASAEVEL